MRIKNCLIWAGALAVTVSAILLPGQLIDKKISYSYEKVFVKNEEATDSMVAWLPENEAYRITSLILQGKIESTKTLIEEITLDKYTSKYGDRLNTYESVKKRLQAEKFWPHVYSKEDGEELELIQTEASKALLYRYKENVFYNYETDVWEIKKAFLENNIYETLLINDSNEIFETELKLGNSAEKNILDIMKYTKEDLEFVLKNMSTLSFSIISEEKVPKGSDTTQRFLIVIGEDKQEYFLDITSTESTFIINMTATDKN